MSACNCILCKNIRAKHRWTLGYRRDYNFDRIKRFLEKRGWTSIRQGSNGNYTAGLFLSACGTKICKISRAINDFYPEWVKWCVRHDNPHLPKIYQARTIARGQYFLTIMEKLEHVCNSNLSFNPQDYISRNGCSDNQLAQLAGMGFGKMVKILTKAFADLGKFTDCHKYNMMARGDTLVFTDPYSSAPYKD